MKSKAKAPTLLADLPAEIDTLGAHSRVMRGISRLIDDGIGAKTIALEGGWGSGKSTVIQLLKENYSGTDVLIHTYDAWSHAGDPLRRAFLASLTDTFTSHKWLTGEKIEWDVELNKLSKKYKENTKRTLPILTTFGKFFSMSLLLIPIGMGLFNEGIKKGGICASLIIGTSLALAPLILSLCYMVLGIIKKQPLDGIFTLILNRTSYEERTVTTETGDPTTIEFQSFFKSLMAASLQTTSNSTNRKLILVIDNLDRLSQTEANEIWSLLRSFVDVSQFNDLNWAERFWILVPIASNFPVTNTLNRDPSNGRENFHDKIFQARFRLPPPVLKGWRQHLSSLLHKAFPVELLHEEPRVLDLYLLLLEPGQSPSPRELVLFVNQLVTLWLQWAERFSLPTLAAYILESRDRDIHLLLIEKTVPRESVRQLLDGDLVSDFACIYFNVTDKATALEILQAPLAETLLIAGDNKRFLEEVIADSLFANVAGKVVATKANVWAKGDPDHLFQAIVAILKAYREILLEQKNDALVVRELTHLVSRIESLAVSCLRGLSFAPMLAASFAEAAKLLLDVFPSERIRITVKELLERQPDRTEPSHNNIQGAVYRYPDETDLNQWVDCLLSIAIHPLIYKAILQKEMTLYLPLEADQFSYVIELCEKQQITELANFLNVRGGQKILVDHLVNTLDETVNFNYAEIRLTDWLLHHKFFEEISLLGTPLSKALRFGTQLTPQTVVNLVIFCTRCLQNNLLIDVIKTIAKNGNLISHFQNALRLNDYPTASAVAWCQFAFFPEISLNDKNETIHSGIRSIKKLAVSPGQMSELANALKEFISENDLQALWINHALINSGLHKLTAYIFDDEGMWAPYLKTLSRDGYRNSVNTFSNIVSEEENSRDERIKSLSLKIREHDEDFQLSVARQIINIEDAWMGDLALDLNLATASEFLKSSETLVSNLTEVEWDDSLQSYSYPLSLTLNIRRYNRQFKLGRSLRNAIHHVINRALSTEDLPSKGISELVNLLAPLERQGLEDDIFEDVAKMDAQSTALYWELAGPLLLKSLTRNGSGQRLAVGRRVLLPILRKIDIEAIKWLTNLLDSKKSVKSLIDDAVALHDAVNEIERLLNNGAIHETNKAMLSTLVEIIRGASASLEPGGS